MPRAASRLRARLRSARCGSSRFRAARRRSIPRSLALRASRRALELAGALGGDGPVDRGDTGELIDAEARAQYRARLSDLAEIEEAERMHDLGRAAAAREEIAHLERELARGLGVGGRLRRGGSAVERARVNVQRRLREAIRRIALHSPALGRHLDHSVRTGTLCRYEPE